MKMTVSCKCGKVQGGAELKPNLSKNSNALRTRPFVMSYTVTGQFFPQKEVLFCSECGGLVCIQ